MTELAVNIERIVREVLAELTARPAVPPPAAAPVAKPAPAIAKPQEKTSEGELTLDCRIVTMAGVAGKLDGVRRLVVPAGAIVTPAVRDELYRRNVAIGFAGKTAIGSVNVHLILVTMGSRFDPKPLADVLSAEGVKVENRQFDCHLAATEDLAGELVKPNTIAALLTRHTAIALCLANRYPGVRAVLASDAPATATAISAVGANLLVGNPAAGSFFQWKQVLSEFCRGGVRPCPEVFRKRLG